MCRGSDVQFSSGCKIHIIIFVALRFHVGVIILRLPCRDVINPLTTPVRDHSLHLRGPQTQDICITFVQCWINVEDVGPTL